MKLVRVLIAVVFFSVFLVPMDSVRADPSPPPPPTTGGIQPFEYQKTEVQMLYERVELDVYNIADQDDPSWIHERANVNAWFVMRNQGNAPESMQVVFPLDDLTSCLYGGNLSSIIPGTFRVEVNGMDVPTTPVVSDHPYKGVAGDCDTMTWMGFTVNFPVAQDVLIKVDYTMNAGGRIEYTLETGAGWKGPIGRGYIIIRFPYTVTKENVLATDNPNYQILFNEIYWSFQNLEPTYENNIFLRYVELQTWQEILKWRNAVRENPKSPIAWLKLIDGYKQTQTSRKYYKYYEPYYSMIPQAYESAIAHNPDSADLYISYADFLWEYSDTRNIPESARQKILSLLNRTLALDPYNDGAEELLRNIELWGPDITYTPPPTIPPTATPLVSATPTLTPTETITPRGYTSPTPWPTETRTPTKKPKASVTPSVTPSPTQTSVPQTPTPSETSSGSGTIPLFAGMAVVFVAGLGIGYFVRRPKKEQQQQ